MANRRTQGNPPEERPQDIHDSYAFVCHAVYETLNAAERKLFKYAVRDSSDFRNLLVEWQRDHDPRASPWDKHTREQMRLKAALRRIAHDGRLPPHGPPLIEVDRHQNTSPRRSAQAGPSQQPQGSGGQGSSGGLGLKIRLHRADPTASGESGVSRGLEREPRAQRTAPAVSGEFGSAGGPTRETRDQREPARAQTRARPSATSSGGPPMSRNLAIRSMAQRSATTAQGQAPTLDQLGPIGKGSTSDRLPRNSQASQSYEASDRGSESSRGDARRKIASSKGCCIIS